MIAKFMFLNWRGWLIRSCLILLLFMSSFMVTSCKKYKEGPKLTLRSVKKRIGGLYTVTNVAVDGADSTAAFLTNYNGENFGFYMDGQLGQYFAGDGLPHTWTFENNKDQIQMFPLSGYSKWGPFFGDGNGARNYDICRLEHKIMTFSTDHNGKKYEITFTEN